MKLPKPINFALRLGITLGAWWLAFSKVHIREVLPLVAQIPLILLLAATLLLHASQLLSAMRTRFYLAFRGVMLTRKPALLLHYVGGLFNSFLPGGAGGDVYKAWWLKRHAGGGTLDMVKVMVAARFNGMWALGALICVFALLTPSIRALHPLGLWLGIGALAAGTLFYSVAAKLVLKEPLREQIVASGYSLSLQMLQLAAVWCIIHGLAMEAHAMEYSVLFMLSSMLAMAPISIGGMGVRELAVLHGSEMLGLPAHAGVAIALTYTVLNLSVPVAGAIIHHFFAPEREMLPQP